MALNDRLRLLIHLATHTISLAKDLALTAQLTHSSLTANNTAATSNALIMISLVSSTSTMQTFRMLAGTTPPNTVAHTWKLPFQQSPKATAAPKMTGKAL